jgi:hypothetical protein
MENTGTVIEFGVVRVVRESLEDVFLRLTGGLTC